MEDKTMKSKEEIRDMAVTAGMAIYAMFLTYVMVAIFG